MDVYVARPKHASVHTSDMLIFIAFSAREAICLCLIVIAPRHNVFGQMKRNALSILRLIAPPNFSAQYYIFTLRSLVF